jgi:hypothetical protein
MKNYIFWCIKPFSPVKVSRRFGRTYRLHFQGRRAVQVRNQHKENMACSLTLKVGATFSSKMLIYFLLYHTISRKTKFFTLSVMRVCPLKYKYVDFDRSVTWTDESRNEYGADLSGKYDWEVWRTLLYGILVKLLI